MSRLRIVAGELGGRFIDAPPAGARPTREKVREAWFSALGPGLDGLRAVDLFAGSGALGLEALSRGAAHVHFVESHRRTADVLAGNVEELGMEARVEVVRRDVGDFLDDRRREDPLFDLALADPPYGSGWPARLAERMRRAPFARMLCVEHRAGALDDLRDVDWRRRYGDTELTFVRGVSPGADGERPGTDEFPREGDPER